MSQKKNEIKRVAIIGAGAAGLVAIKQCLEEGLVPVCFEKSNSVGGHWNLKANAKNSSSTENTGSGGSAKHFAKHKSPIYDSMVVHTSKDMMQFSDFPIPDGQEWPEFLPHQKVGEYLERYAKHFQLEKHIRFGANIRNIRPVVVDGIETGAWQVIYKKSQIIKSEKHTPPPSRPDTPASFASEISNLSAPETREISSGDHRGVSLDYLSGDESNKNSILFNNRSSEDLQEQKHPIPRRKLYKKEIFDFVMVCTGHQWKPRIPVFQGQQEFKGPIIHSNEYNMPYPYKDETVLVIGVGNSGLGISSDIAPHASKVFLSSRSGTWITPRTTLFGMPTDHLATRAVHSIPRYILNYAVETLITIHYGDMEKYNLKPKHKFLESNPVIGTSILQHINEGSVVVKPNIKGFTATAVEFEDDTSIEIDAVILCTGFVIENPFLHDKSNPNDRVRLYKNVFSTRYRNLAFLGMVRPNGSIFPVAELQARWAARVFNGNCTLPSLGEMRDLADVEYNGHILKYVDRDRLSIAVDSVDYMDQLADLIGCRPDLWQLWKDTGNWPLAFRVSFGPCISSQYRIFGPGSSREIAEDAIRRASVGVDFKSRIKAMREM